MNNNKCVCKKCGYEWIARVDNPKKCPNPECQSHKWHQSIKEEIEEFLDIDKAEEGRHV